MCPESRKRPKARPGKKITFTRIKDRRPQTTREKSPSGAQKSSTTGSGRVPFDRSRLRPPPDREAMERAWIEEERRRRSQEQPQEKLPAWGFSHIEERKLEHLRAWCGDEEFDKWLWERERAVEGHLDHGAVIDLVNLDLVYAQKFKTILEYWGDLAAAGSPLAAAWLETAFVPSGTRRYRRIPLRATMLKVIHKDLRQSGVARDYDAIDETARRWERLVGERLDFNILKENIIYGSKKKNLPPSDLQPFELLAAMSSWFWLDIRIVRAEPSLLRDDCTRCRRYWIPDWASWKRSSRFARFKKDSLKHLQVAGTQHREEIFAEFIKDQNALVEKHQLRRGSHCGLWLRPNVRHVPCPYETKLSRWKRDSSNLEQFARLCITAVEHNLRNS